MLRANMLLLLFLFSWLASACTASVSYDHRSIIINGRKRILISGSIHYPRSTPEVLTHNANVVHSFFIFLFLRVFLAQFFKYCVWLQMWPDLIQKAKEGGVDVIQTYVFWNGHEPSPGQVMQIKFNFPSCFFLMQIKMYSLTV